jgi:YcxB-like protein
MEIRFEGQLTDNEFRACRALMRPRFFRMWWLFPSLSFWLRATRKRNRLLHAPVKGTLSETGIRWKLEGVSSNEVAWSGFERYVETEDLILAYYAPKQALAVHRRYFASLAGWDTFRKLLSEKLPRRR